MTTSYRVLYFPIERLTYRMAKCTQSMALGSGRWRAGGGQVLQAGGREFATPHSVGNHCVQIPPKSYSLLCRFAPA